MPIIKPAISSAKYIADSVVKKSSQAMGYIVRKTGTANSMFGNGLKSVANGTKGLLDKAANTGKNLREAVKRKFWGKLAPKGTVQSRTLYHYTDEAGLSQIIESNSLRASTKASNPRDVRYGNGQYVSDFAPGTKTPAQLSREFLGQPFQGKRFTHYIEIDVTDLQVIQGRNGVFVIPNDVPLDITGRIIGSGRVPPVKPGG